MKELGKIILYLVATVVLGALLAPQLYWGLMWLNGHGLLLNLADVEFQRVFHRGILVAAIVLLWPLVKWIQIPHIRGLGLRPNPLRWQDLAIGFLASFLVMALLAAVLIHLEIYTLRKSPKWDELRAVMVSAVVVSLLEEGLFRGAFLGLLNRTMRPFLSLFAVSSIYSVVHFLKPDKEPVTDAVITWTSGFPLLLEALEPFKFHNLSEFLIFFGGFATLFAVGWILGWTRLKTGSLWMAIGLHAGWILGKMGLGKIARRKITDTLPWLGEDITIGLVSLGMVILTGLLVWYWIGRIRKTPHEHSVAPAKVV